MPQKTSPSSIIGQRDTNTERRVAIPDSMQPELSTLQQVRREMAALYRAAQRGDVSTDELKSLIYALSQMAKLIEIGKLEERMDTLEKMATADERTH